MKPAEYLTIIAFLCFLFGVMFSLRDYSSKIGLTLMWAGIGLDILVVILPKFGVPALKMGITAMNPVIVAAIVLGLSVWILFAVAMIVLYFHHDSAFQRLLGITTIIWFVDMLLFYYGSHHY